MRVIETILGEVTVNDVRMGRSSGYGQYSIQIDIEFEGKPKTIKIHSTDSQLYDEISDQDGDIALFLLDRIEYIIMRSIDDYVSSL